MENNMKQTVEMVESCATFFNKYQPLFMNDEQLLDVWDCFRDSYLVFKSRFDVINDDVVSERQVSIEQRSSIVKQIFKVSAFLSVWAEETQNSGVIELSNQTITELESMEICALTKLSTQFKAICVENVDSLETLAFNRSMLQNLEEALDILQSACVLNEMEKGGQSEIQSLLEAEQCLNRVDDLLFKYQDLYQGVYNEYTGLRQRETVS